jgi:hypothetical protein
MAEKRKYIKRSSESVIAVQLDLDTNGFEYRKWGSVQTCKRGDWILNNGGEVYTVDRETFAKTYSQKSPGIYRKTGTVWAEVAKEDGSIKTKEGVTNYKKGSYLVFNSKNGADGYAVTASKFKEMYRPSR